MKAVQTASSTPNLFALTILQLKLTLTLLFVQYLQAFHWIFTNLPFNVFQQVLPALLKIWVLKLYWTISLQFDNTRINMNNFTEAIFKEKKKKTQITLKAHIKKFNLWCSDYPVTSFEDEDSSLVAENTGPLLKGYGL